MWVTKLLISPVKKRDLLPKNDQIWPKIGIFGQFGPGHAGIFGALLVGQLVVEARGLYLARHLFTLFKSMELLDLLKMKKISKANKHRHITPKHRISDFLPADSFAVTKLTKWVAACLCHTFGSSLVKVAHYNSRSIPSASPVHLFDKSPALHSTYRTPLSSAASSLHET